jgi:ribosomal protein S18 acetylase RimI-like enzyme
MKLYIRSSNDGEFINSDITMIPATDDDLDLVIEAELYMEQEHYGDMKMPKSVEEELIQDSIDSMEHTRIIKYDDEPIGMLQAYELEGYWYIGGIYLIEEYRGQGIGREILEYEIDNHEDMVICLNVYKSNIHAIELYESLGFEITEDDEDRYIMKLFPEDFKF